MATTHRTLLPVTSKKHNCLVLCHYCATVPLCQCATTVPLPTLCHCTVSLLPDKLRLPKTLALQIFSFSSHFRLVQQPNCIKVPKEVCVNERTNPKKVKIIIEMQCPLSPTITSPQVTRPVVKEWCYRPADLKSPTSRLALSQFFSKN